MSSGKLYATVGGWVGGRAIGGDSESIGNRRGMQVLLNMMIFIFYLCLFQKEL